jgi:hypothetical protein
MNGARGHFGFRIADLEKGLGKANLKSAIQNGKAAAHSGLE